MNLANKCLPLMLCLTLSANVTAGLLDKVTGGEKPKRVELTESSDKAAVFKQAFSDDGVFAPVAKPVEFAARKVAISAFQVEFVTQHVASASGSGSGMGSGGVEKTFTLKGATDEQMVAITEKLHQQFRDLLTQRGYEVLPADALMNSAFKSELTNADGTPLRKDEKGGVLGSARSMGLIGRSTGDTHGGSVTVTAKGTSPNVFAVKFGMPSSMKLADELEVAVVQVRLQVNFMQIDTSNTALFSISEAEGKPRNMLAAQGSHLTVFWPGSKMAGFIIKKSLLLPNSASDKVTEIAATEGEKAGSVAKGALSVVGGFFGVGAGSGGGGLSGALGGLSGQLHSQGGSGKFEVTADADYENKLSQDLGLALSLYAEALPK